MPALDSLKVDSAPAAFVPIAKAHNALADLIASMVGSNGVKVTVSEGRILIELSGTGGTGSSSGGGGVPDPLTIDTLTVTGNTQLSGYLRGTTATFTGDVDVDGDFTASWVFSNNFSVSGQTLTLQTVQVCDGGTTKSMYVLGSGTF